MLALAKNCGFLTGERAELGGEVFDVGGIGGSPRTLSVTLALNGRPAEAAALMKELSQTEFGVAGPFVVKTDSTAGIAAICRHPLG
jgi:hypothetical protein